MVWNAYRNGSNTRYSWDEPIDRYSMFISCGNQRYYTYSSSTNGSSYGSGTHSGSRTYSKNMRPVVVISLDSIRVNLTGSGSSGNPYTLTAK